MEIDPILAVIASPLLVGAIGWLLNRATRPQRLVRDMLQDAALAQDAPPGAAYDALQQLRVEDLSTYVRGRAERSAIGWWMWGGAAAFGSGLIGYGLIVALDAQTATPRAVIVNSVVGVILAVGAGVILRLRYLHERRENSARLAAFLEQHPDLA